MECPYWLQVEIFNVLFRVIPWNDPTGSMASPTVGCPLNFLYITENM
jgi:hypothetical protein